jgi:hypothetical protein
MTMRGWLKGCGIGCGSLVLIVAILLAMGIWSLRQDSRRAVETRERVEEAHATQTDFTPPLDGLIEADRLERFLGVRRVLMPSCEAFTEFQGGFGRMERRGEIEAEDLETKGLWTDLGAVAKGLFRFATNANQYAVTRNEALLAHEMGLGEYTWIYVIAYYSWLQNEPAKLMPDDRGPRILQERVRGDLIGMMQRHVAELETTLARPPSDAGGLEQHLGAWRSELMALEKSDVRLPFQDGVPPGLETSMEPFRDEFQGTFCAATGELDIARTEKSGLQYEHR